VRVCTTSIWRERERPGGEEGGQRKEKKRGREKGRDTGVEEGLIETKFQFENAPHHQVQRGFMGVDLEVRCATARADRAVGFRVLQVSGDEHLLLLLAGWLALVLVNESAIFNSAQQRMYAK